MTVRKDVGRTFMDAPSCFGDQSKVAVAE